MRAINAHPELQLQVVVGASALLDRFGAVVDVIEADGFRPDAKVSLIVEGETPLTMAKSTGLGLLELPTIFDFLKPDLVITVGDRFETMATAIAASYMNIPLAHTMGGEVSGTIDESIRHAVTKLSHIHFPATEDAGRRIVRMGEQPSQVHVVGCPRIDLAMEVIRGNGKSYDNCYVHLEGVGGQIDLTQPYLLVSQHPVTTEYGDGEGQITETLAALLELGMPTIMLWPNADAGSEDIAQGMRKFRERHGDQHIRFFKNFPVESYLRLMNGAACVIGNSSAPIREGASFGVPAVSVGSRQAGRQHGQNVINAEHIAREIVDATQEQIRHGRYAPDHLYGDGHAGQRIAEKLATANVRIQKQITY